MCMHDSNTPPQKKSGSSTVREPISVVADLVPLSPLRRYRASTPLTQPARWMTLPRLALNKP